MIEVGNLVMISPNSEYFRGECTNPKWVVGIVRRVEEIGSLPIWVEWPGGFNSYDQKDLIKIT